MKSPKFILAAMIALGTLVTFSPMTRAAEDAPATKQAPRGGARFTPEERVKQMDAQLKLSDEQKTKITAIYKEEADKSAELRKKTELSQQERGEAMRKMRTETTDKVKKILTSEQTEKWDKYLKEQQSRRGQSRKSGGGNQ
jgi:Spy/CpxP family protein refolding chaperone